MNSTLRRQPNDRVNYKDDDLSAALDCPVSTETQLADDAYQAALKAVIYGHKF